MTPDPHRALKFWPGPLRSLPLERVRSGFSGAQVWRLRSNAGDLCLRTSPPGESASRAWPRFGWMATARATGLRFVPAVLPTLTGQPFTETMGRLWEVQDWMPGEVDWERSPSPRKLAAACEALARLHLAWKEGGIPGLVPAVARRLQVLAGTVPDWLAKFVRPAVAGLESWRAPRMQQPCLCDIWHGNVLFSGDEVSGIVDYGDMRLDAPATDVARLLGDMAEDDEEQWACGLAAYRKWCALSDEEEQLARALDRAGTLAAAIRWTHRLETGLEDQARQRAERVLGRVRRWQ